MVCREREKREKERERERDPIDKENRENDFDIFILNAF